MDTTKTSRLGPLVTLVEVVSTLLGKHPTTIYRAVNSGHFPFAVVDLGGRLYVPRVGLEKLVSPAPAPVQLCPDCGGRVA